MAITSNPVSTFLFYFISLIVFLFLIGKLPRFECKKPEEKLGKIEDMPIFICHEKKGKIYNAWYDPKKKRISITKSLFDILSEEERKAVLYHEVGHSKNKSWDLITRFTSFLWLTSVSLILTMVVLIYLSNYDWLSKITLLGTFLAFLPIYAVSFMISSWVNEHEADVYATKIVGFKPKAQALIKLHVYNNLEGCENTISMIEFSDSFELNELTYLQVLKSIIKEIFVYMRPSTVLNQPLPKTHPPLRLRLERIMNCK